MVFWSPVIPSWRLGNLSKVYPTLFGFRNCSGDASLPFKCFCAFQFQIHLHSLSSAISSCVPGPGILNRSLLPKLQVPASEHRAGYLNWMLFFFSCCNSHVGNCTVQQLRRRASSADGGMSIHSATPGRQRNSPSKDFPHSVEWRNCSRIWSEWGRCLEEHCNAHETWGLVRVFWLQSGSWKT